jgi:hypothetical protein
MAFGNNQAAARPGAPVHRAGGTIFKFRHPFLTGQLNKTSTVDEVDVSKALQLNSNFFQANPTQDSAHQEVLVDGTVITITNHVLAGEMTLQALSTTGFVGTGDFIACAQVIVASGDDTGGVFTVVRDFNGKRRVRVYYGVTFRRVPHELIAGNTVVPYPVIMLYAGWTEGIAAASTSAKVIWATANKYGVKAVYGSYDIDSVSVESEGPTTPFEKVNNASADDAVDDPTKNTFTGVLANALDATALPKNVIDPSQYSGATAASATPVTPTTPS